MTLQYELSDLILHRAASEAFRVFFEKINDDGILLPVETIVFSEKDPREDSPLCYGEWECILWRKALYLASPTTAGLLAAAEYAFAFLEKGEMPPEKKNALSFPLPEPLLDGHPLSRFRILYERKKNTGKKRAMEDLHRLGATRQAAEDLKLFLGEKTGAVLPVSLLEEEIPLSIVIASPTSPLPYGSYRLVGEKEKVTIYGGDICALESGICRLGEILLEKETVSLEEIFGEGALQERRDYESSPENFIPCYKGRYSLSEEEIALEKKEEKLSDPTKPLFILAHRGEHTYYPENSLEACISAWRCGADSVELDISRTRDGVIVCMHDESLLRTTNAAEKMGKNGLPDSPNLRDWSLEELRSLCLLDSYGDQSTFIIPTLEEMLCAAEGRIFLHVDKKFDYREEVFPLMKKNGLTRCLYLCNYLDSDGIAQIRDDFSGRRLQSILRIPQMGLKKLKAALEALLTDERGLSPNAVLINDYHKYLAEHKNLAIKYRGKLRLASWMMWGTDTEFYWKEAVDCGFGILMTNFPIRLLHFTKNLH